MSSSKRKREHVPVVEMTPPTCPACGSDSRDWFASTITRFIDGYKFTWRRTKCRNCSQIYRVKSKVKRN